MSLLNRLERKLGRFAIENALHWLTAYRFDGLRLDAMDAIVEPGRTRLLREISAAVGRLAAATGRHIHLVLENYANQAALLDPLADPPRGQYRAQWNDDFHHAFHVLLTNETGGYYRDYQDPRRHVRRSLAEGFAYQGEPSIHRNGEARGEARDASAALAGVLALARAEELREIVGRRFGQQALDAREVDGVDRAANRRGHG